MALTDAMVRNAKPKKSDYQLYDIPGLSINVTPAGTKSWKFRIMKGGKRKNITFGEYPFVTLKDARQQAEDTRFLIKNDLVPEPVVKDESIESSTAMTFSAFANRWRNWKAKKLYPEETEIKINKRQSTISQIDRALKNDINPVIGDIPIDLITKQHTLLIQRNIEMRATLSVAEKVRTWLNEMFRFAIAEGSIEINPAADLDVVAMPSRRTRHNPYLTLEELPELLTAFNHYNGELQTLLGVKLLLLTGVRTGELRAAKPEQFDLEKGLWLVPPENLKQIKKLIRQSNSTAKIPPYIVPLSNQAVEIIKKLLELKFSSQPYLLGHRYNPELMISENTLNKALQRMGFQNRLTGHGIRATLSTALNEMGYASDWIEAQLSHSNKEKDVIRDTYNHAMYVEQRKKMMQDWADKLDKLDTWNTAEAVNN